MNTQRLNIIINRLPGGAPIQSDMTSRNERSPHPVRTRTLQSANGSFFARKMPVKGQAMGVRSAAVTIGHHN